MTYSVRVTQFAEPFSVEAGQTILDAALSRDLPYPHGCTAGNCGACKSELLAGEIDLLPHSEFALTAAEAAAGKILACRAVPWSDCSVAILGDDELVAHPERHLTCRIVALDRPTHDIVAVRLETVNGGPFAFSAGQYASVTFDDVAPRDFSMANAPDDGLLEFHVRMIPGGRAGAHLTTKAAVGDGVRVRGPFGGSYLRDGHDGPVLLVGGGTGLGPMLSILETIAARDPARHVALYVAARDARDLYAQGRIEAVSARHTGLSVRRVLSEPAAAGSYRVGYVADAVAADLVDVAGWKAYAAGPPVMVETLTAVLLAKGMAPRDIHADAFIPAAAEVAT